MLVACHVTGFVSIYQPPASSLRPGSSSSAAASFLLRTSFQPRNIPSPSTTSRHTTTPHHTQQPRSQYSTNAINFAIPTTVVRLVHPFRLFLRNTGDLSKLPPITSSNYVITMATSAVNNAGWSPQFLRVYHGLTHP